jgi:para-nitrobenzyl esterase
MNDQATAVKTRTSLGEIQGEAEDGVVRFRTVPYAIPPVGALRFAPPLPPKPWAGCLDARWAGPIAPQPPSRLRMAMGEFEREQSEDCLTLAISTPAVDSKRRPVIVWLHGGAYLSGAGSLDWYDGGPLAKAGDVVVVGVNYRLGPLGFLQFPGLSDGMMGLHDMVAALRFVQDHIAAFGGDPDRVTLMGQSAGGGAIMRLLDLALTEGLFHRVIVQSGPPRPGPKAAEATRRTRRFMQLLDIDPDAADAGELIRRAPVEALIAQQSVLARELAQFGSIEPAFPPCFDNYTPNFAEQLAQKIASRGIEMVIGTTTEEMNAFFVADPAMANPDKAAVAERFNVLTGSADTMETYRRHRPGGTLRELLGDVTTDYRFTLPSLDLAQRVNAIGGRAFVYVFNWSGPNSPWKACHCIELPFTLGTLPAWNAPMLEGLEQATYDGLSATMMAAWSAFARSGDPSLSDLAWPSYGVGRETMCFGSTVCVIGDPAGVAWKVAG